MANLTITNASQMTSGAMLRLVMVWRRSCSVRSSDSGFGSGVGCPFRIPLFISRAGLARGVLCRGRIRLFVTRA